MFSEVGRRRFHYNSRPTAVRARAAPLRGEARPHAPALIERPAEEGRARHARAAPARGRQAPTPARTPTTQRSPRGAAAQWSADGRRRCAGSWASLVGRLGDDSGAAGHGAVGERVGKAAGPDELESTPAPPPRAPPPGRHRCRTPTPPERKPASARGRRRPRRRPTAARSTRSARKSRRVQGRRQVLRGDRRRRARRRRRRDLLRRPSDAEANVLLDSAAASAASARRPPRRRRRRPQRSPREAQGQAGDKGNLGYLGTNGALASKAAEAGTRNPAIMAVASAVGGRAVRRGVLGANSKYATRRHRCDTLTHSCRGCMAADAERGPQPPPRLCAGRRHRRGGQVLAPLLAVGARRGAARCGNGRRSSRS